MVTTPTNAAHRAAEEIEKFVPRFFSDDTLCPKCSANAGVCQCSFAEMLAAIIEKHFLTPTAIPEGSREAFEREARFWCLKLQRHVKDSGPYKAGEYVHEKTFDMWLAWQAATKAAQQRPAGDWVLVPREPTEEMMEAALDSLGQRVVPYTAERESGVPIECDMDEETANYCNVAAKEGYAAVYRAMLATPPLSANPASPEGRRRCRGRGELRAEPVPIINRLVEEK